MQLVSKVNEKTMSTSKSDFFEFSGSTEARIKIFILGVEVGSKID